VAAVSGPAYVPGGRIVAAVPGRGAGLRGWHGAPGESDRVIGVVVVALLVLLAGVIIVAMG
jgi:hypothetical protein